MGELKVQSDRGDVSEEVKRSIPKLKSSGENALSAEVASENQLRDLFGVKTLEAGDGLLMSALNMLGENGDSYRDLMTSMAVEMEPRDAVEAMLVSQMTGTHVAMSMLSCRTIDATSPKLREGYERSMTRLSRNFIAQMDALKKYRSVPAQHVRVGQVSVHDGGQAIVGVAPSMRVKGL